LEHLPVEVLEAGFQRNLYDIPDNSLGLKMANFEKIVLLNAVKASKGNMSKTAKLLGISRAALYEKFRKYNLVNSRN
jgi:transcriptional regulator of acetoin/glycerol metabolism